MLEIQANLIAVDADLPDAESVILHLAGKLFEFGAVREDYGEAAVHREQSHPTGLPTKPFCIAFPHAEAEGVLRSALAVASLREPVTFRNMGDPDEELPVEMVFLLANRSPEEQVRALRNLALVFSEPDKLVELRAITSADDMAVWLEHEINQAG
jgi:galactitol PTS system EIIA component